MSKEIQNILASLPSVDVLLKQIDSNYPHGKAKEATQQVLASFREDRNCNPYEFRAFFIKRKNTRTAPSNQLSLLKSRI